MEKKLRFRKILTFTLGTIISILIISLLVGKKEGTLTYNPETNTTYQNNQQEERFYTSEESEYILIDRKTNCKYLNNSEKITPLLDSSGKPDCK